MYPPLFFEFTLTKVNAVIFIGMSVNRTQPTLHYENSSLLLLDQPPVYKTLLFRSHHPETTFIVLVVINCNPHTDCIERSALF